MTAARSGRGRTSLALALVVLLVGSVAPVLARTPLATRLVEPSAAADFPAGFERYHTYPEMVAVVDATVAAYPSIVRRVSLGRSTQGREIVAAKISDRVEVDENEPEVVLDGLHHAREHLSLEQMLSVLRLLTSGYGTSSRIRALVDSREVWLVFAVNPDGAEYDIDEGPYDGFWKWRKNRQPNTDGSYGTDLNRNYGYRWGCCGGSSGTTTADTYRGRAAWSAPETRAFRDFVNSRVVGGRQQIRAHVTFHSAGEEVLWPFGYTKTDVPADMTAEDHAALSALGRQMAATNGYEPKQSSSLYVTDGDQIDWMYGVHRIFSYTFEMYPSSGGSMRWYAPQSVIERETKRNHSAVLLLLERAACPWAAAGAAFAARDCGPLYDDLEGARGWTTDAGRTDTATSGRWERADPSPTSLSGAKQLGTTTSGMRALVTGAAAGSSAGANDVDGGVTTVRSPLVTLPTGRAARLSFRFAFGHSNVSSAADAFRARIVPASGPSAVVFQQLGAAVDRDAAWATATADLSRWAGQSVRIQFEAVDAAAASLVEAMVDDVRVTLP